MRGIKRSIILLLMMGLLSGPAAVAAAASNSIIKIGSDVTVEAGQKVRSVVAIGGQITVSGAVEKSVTAIGGSVVLTRTAVVGGNVTALGGVIVMARDAEVGGSLTEINSSNLFETFSAAVSSEWEGWSWIFAMISLAIFFVILVLAMLIVALLPKPVHIVSEAITENTFKVVLCGILGLVLIAPLALLLTISVVGIALIPLEMIIVVCSVLLGFIAVGQTIGRKALSFLKRSNAGVVRETFWGLIILWLIGWIPYIGWMIKALAIVIGLGATLVTRFGTYQGWKCPPLPPVAGDAGGSVNTTPPGGQGTGAGGTVPLTSATGDAGGSAGG
ncbi:MAG: hypothetical protein KKF02_09640 [Proteobacteria bacterium]|nr:hypothetical protein [Pseudomonadota bacterium]